MAENETNMTAAEARKQKIRERYKGINLDEIDVIEALPKVNYMEETVQKRVAVYARVSTDDPNQTSSYELQKNHYQDVVARQPNWTLIEIYADEGISGTSLKHRDSFIRMIEDCKAGKIDMIITKSVSRFARNIVDCIYYQRELKALNPPVGILFETEGIYTLNDNSEMSLAFIATLAQEESHTKSEIMNASIEMRFRRGIFLTPILLGYDHNEDGELVINEDEAKTVRLIFYMYLYGYTCQEIAETLTTLKRKTKKGNTRWAAGSILQILQNERHCGDVLARKTFTPSYLDHKSKKNNKDRNQYRRQGHHEAIINRDDFIAVQHMIRNAKYGNKEILPSLHVIEDGILRGFVPIHPRWAGFKPEDYINASESIASSDVEISEEIIEGQSGEFDMRGFEVARVQFFETAQRLSVTFSADTLTFGIEGIRKLNNPLYADILLHPTKQLLAVRPGKKDNKYSYNWAKVTNGVYSPKSISATSFMPTIYSLLNWDLENKYRVIGYRKQKDDECLLLFDLKDSEILVPTTNLPMETVQDNEMKPITTGKNSKNVVAFPKEWADGFGDSYYNAVQQETLTQKGPWNSQSQGTPFETTSLNVTPPDEIRTNIDEIITDIRGGQNG